jgi:HNH endonuclease
MPKTYEARQDRTVIAGETWHLIDPAYWKLAPGLVYEVSSHGRVRRFFPNRYEQGPAYKIKLTKLAKGDEYLRVKLVAVGGSKRFAVAHLVAHAFIGPRPKGLQVNHIDGDKLNNCVSNLEYVTRGENVRHAVRVMGAFCGPRNGWHTKPEAHDSHRGERCNTAKLTEDDVRTIRSLRGTMPIAQIARRYGVWRNAIYAILNRKSWSHVS